MFKSKKSISKLLLITIFTTILNINLPGFTRAAKATVNDVENGGFEQTTTTGVNANYWNNNTAATSWTLSGNNSTNHYAKATVVNDVISSGNNALKLEALGTADRLFMYQTINNITSADVGKKFMLSAWVKTQNILSGKNVGIRVQQFTGANATGTQIGANSDTTKANDFDWSNLSNTVTIASGCTSVKITFIFGFSAATTGTAWIDEVSFKEVVDNTQSTGSAATTQSNNTTSAGAAIESNTNTTTTAAVSTNVDSSQNTAYASTDIGYNVTNGGFEQTTTTGVNANYWNDNTAATAWILSGNNATNHYAKAAVVKDEIHSGSNAVKIEALGTADRLFMYQNINNITSADEGKKYMISSWVKTQNILSGKNVGIRVQQFPGANATGTQIGTSSDISKINDFDWSNISNTVTIAPGCTSIKITFIFGFSGATTGTAWVDDISFREVIDSMQISESAVSMKVGGTHQLTPIFKPSTATNMVNWTSTDSSIASVDNNGVVTGIHEGSATISGTSVVDPTKAVSCTFNIGVPVESVTMQQENITVSLGNTGQLNAIVAPNDASSKIVTWSSDNNSIATVSSEGIVTGVGPGTTTITATSSIDNSKKATCTVTVSGLKLDQNSAVISKGHNLLLTASITPAVNLVWTSSDNNVAIVKDGLVKAVGIGNAVITVTTEDNSAKASCNLTVNPYVSDEYDILRQRYMYSLIGGQSYDLNDATVQNVINSIATDAQKLWSTMDPTGTYLWTDVPGIVQDGSKRKTGEVTTNYTRLMTMSKAFLMEGSPLKGNAALLKDIIRGLEWMDQNLYNSNITYSMFVGDNGTGNGNWYSFCIGAPKQLNDIVTIMYDYLTPDQVNRYESAVKHFVPDPTVYLDSYNSMAPSTGGNLSDTSKVAIIAGINKKDSDYITAGKNSISNNFKLVTSGEGIYDDGSFIQHTFVPYNNTYGQVLLQGIADILRVLNGSTWEIKDSNVNNIYNWLETGIEPLIYKGSAMDMASGRAISRGGFQDHQLAQGLINVFIQYAQFAPEPYSSHYKSVVKYWIQQDSYMDFLSNCSDIIIKEQALEILNDPSIIPSGELVGNYIYSNMDRVVHRTDSFSLGISMYSKRVSNYETMNGENLKGWNTGDGMTYLYNGDLGNFADDFWPTVNPYRLPGTTVDLKAQPTSPSDQSATKITSPQSWVGGTSLGNFGAAGMYLDKRKMDSSGVITNPLQMNLQAKKSWFMFDKEVVCLGSGITSTDNRTIETIVDNRKISDANNNILTVDGVEQSNVLGTTNTMPDVKWMHLAGDVANSDIGYYFPDGADLKSLREARTGAWSDVNINGKTTPITRNYVTTWFDHGANPSNDVYAYVLLPNMSKDQVASYSQKPDINVLVNTPEVQAVKNNTLNILGANFWTDSVQNADYITVNKKSSVMSKISNGYLELSISDPTMTNAGTIEVDINQPNLIPVNVDSRITVTASENTTHISVNVAGANGKSIAAKFTTGATGAGAADYIGLKDQVETEVQAYEALAKGDLSTQTLVNVANEARGKIVTAGLTDAHISEFQKRIDAADIKVAAAQKVINDAAKAAVPIVVTNSGSSNTSNKTKTYVKTNNDVNVEVGSHPTINSIKETWNKKDETWYMISDDGTTKKGWYKDTDQKWYMLDRETGAMITGWFKDVDQKWYKLDNSGKMITGWFKDADQKWYKLDDSGAMIIGWLKDNDGKWYYLNSDGSMASNTYVGRYYLNFNGVWVE